MADRFSKSGILWAAFFVVIVAFKFGQISDGNDGEDKGSPSLPPNLPPNWESKIQPRPSLQKYEASSLIRDFYASIDDDEFAVAWEALSPNARDELQGFDSWRQGQEFNIATKVSDVWIERTSRLAAVAHVNLRAVDVDACGDRITQEFDGSWLVAERQKQLFLSSPDIQKSSGLDPVFEEAACPIEAALVEPPPPDPDPSIPTEPYSQPSEPTDPDCDPNYAGACLDPNSYDYDCSGGSGDGPDYTGYVEVVGSDPYDLDSDGDGSGCE
ncbi:MAG: hypothetical protein JJE13_01255 [Thermoleophilia bacterium]|nr:hypothetical protein [Thermoleophilia bacterium]